MQWEEKNIISTIFLPKVQNPNVLMREDQTNSNWEAFYKIRISGSWKSKKKADGLFQTEDEKDKATKCNPRFWTGSGCNKGHNWDKWRSLNGVYAPDVDLMVAMWEWQFIDFDGYIVFM